MREKETLQTPPRRPKCSGWFVRWLFLRRNQTAHQILKTRLDIHVACIIFAIAHKGQRAAALIPEVETGLYSLGSYKWKMRTWCKPERSLRGMLPLCQLTAHIPDNSRRHQAPKRKGQPYSTEHPLQKEARMVFSLPDLHHPATSAPEQAHGLSTEAGGSSLSPV